MAKEDKARTTAFAELVGHDPTMADALSTLTKDLAPGEDALFVRFEPKKTLEISEDAKDTQPMPVYAPPSAPPLRAEVNTFEMQTVKLDPEADERRATTQRHMRSPGPDAGKDAASLPSGATRSEPGSLKSRGWARWVLFAALAVAALTLLLMNSRRQQSDEAARPGTQSTPSSSHTVEPVQTGAILSEQPIPPGTTPLRAAAPAATPHAESPLEPVSPVGAKNPTAPASGLATSKPPSKKVRPATSPAGEPLNPVPEF